MSPAFMPISPASPPVETEETSVSNVSSPVLQAALKAGIIMSGSNNITPEEPDTMTGEKPPVTKATLAAGLVTGSLPNITMEQQNLTGEKPPVTQATLAAGTMTASPPSPPSGAHNMTGAKPPVTQASVAAGLSTGLAIALPQPVHKAINRSQPSSADLPLIKAHKLSQPHQGEEPMDTCIPGMISEQINNRANSPTKDSSDAASDNEDDDESDISTYGNIDPPKLQPVPIIANEHKEDNDIILVKPGIQVCTFEYSIRPPIGVYYRVNRHHHMVKVSIEPGVIYQTDSACNLYRLGIS